ncbi:MAG: phosphodiester glycosidase family protein [Paracoccaceae bacterium]
MRAEALVAGLVLGLGAAATAKAAECRSMTFAGEGYALCEVAAGEDLRLWLTGEDGAPMGTFERLRGWAGDRGLSVVFAMNAGMYHPDRRPVGLYVEDGREGAPLVTGASKGNFGMLPNGVFCVSDRGFAVTETGAFATRPPACLYATQSGPMLVIGGALHPRFLPGSDSLHVRNGVGVSPEGRTAWFAISDRPVTFHAFARLFFDGLGVPDALYLDGSISRLYAPALGRDDAGFPMGPILGVVVPEG